MSTKIFRIALLTLVLLLCFTSCTLVDDLKRDAANVAVFALEFVDLIENPTLEKAEELTHPSSPLTAENVIERLENDEKLAGVDPSTQSITLEEVGEATFKFHDAELGGNVYEIGCVVVIGETRFTVVLTMLSNDDGFGIYDFEIK